MTINSIGDMAHHLMLRSRSVTLSNQVATLTQELSSGKVSDTAKHLNGDVGELLALGRDVSRAKIYQTATREAGILASAVQTGLTQVGSTVKDYGASLLQIGDGLTNISTEALSDKAEIALGAIISALNTSAAGQNLFSGTATNRTALQSTDTMMAALSDVVSDAQTAGEVVTAVESWFDDPDGFQSTMYSGSQAARDPIRIGPDDQIRLGMKADDPLFRDLMKTVAIGALSGSPDLSLSDAERHSLLTGAGKRLPSAADDLTALQAQVGGVEARIEEVGARHAATLSSLEMARTTMLRADPYETAVELEQVQFQLQSLYTLTARNARFSLLSYLE